MLTIKQKVFLILRLVKDDVLYIFYIFLTLIYKVKLATDEVMDYAESVVNNTVENVAEAYQSVKQIWNIYTGANRLVFVKIREDNTFKNKINYIRTNVSLNNNEKYKLYSNLLAPPQL